VSGRTYRALARIGENALSPFNIFRAATFNSHAQFSVGEPEALSNAAIVLKKCWSWTKWNRELNGKAVGKSFISISQGELCPMGGQLEFAATPSKLTGTHFHKF